jgi:hypothetical protein
MILAIIFTFRSIQILSASNTVANSDLLECWRHDRSIQPIDLLVYSRFGHSQAGQSRFTLYRSIGWYTCRWKAIGSLADP